MRSGVLTFPCGKTITRGYTDEADKLLNYLVYASYYPLIHLPDISLEENGIFDALEKRFLRSFIFGIYLVCFPFRWKVLILIAPPQDPKDPNK